MHRGVMFQYFEWNYPNDGRLWRELAAQAVELHNLGVTAVWMPPAYKGLLGPNDVGYAPYDLYDLGEYDQKGGVRTKYGTTAEFLAAVRQVQACGMDAYADVVLNHRMGGDETEEVEIEEISREDRNLVVSDPYAIRAWSRYTFPGRGDAHSTFKWRSEHFNAFGADANQPGVSKIFRVRGKSWSGEVSFEHGNFDYLMGADVDTYHPEVRAELFTWLRWFVERTGVRGLRLDAIKHLPWSFYRDACRHLHEHFGQRELFAVGEYWSGDVGELHEYLRRTEGCMRLFDVPLHFNLHRASQGGNDFDLRTVFDGTLVKENPLMAVTFVDNHDSQPGQALESWVDDWFKQHAYALIMLRRDGYPCVFYGDYFGNEDQAHPLTRHRKIIDDMLQARAKYMYGDQHDYFDHPNCVGWTWTGDADNPAGMAVLMSNGDAGRKRMTTHQPNATYRDLTNHVPEPVTTDAAGEAEFTCAPGKLSIWCRV